ncbi:MAG: transposase [Desulfuromonas sp.]|nr:MAG: transposase [Desulfuromonas sp.]
MARLARAVAPGYPHHITQRGNRRQQTFFCDDDYQAYLDLMAEWCHRYKVEIWAWCLMPNHVHLIAVPETEDGLARAIGEAHRRYTRRINFRQEWRGHLWQERFASFIMDENYLLAASRYVELNPVAADLCQMPGDYRWSSARAHLRDEDDGLTTLSPLREMVSDWGAFLATDAKVDNETFRRHERTGRPLADASFVTMLEETLQRPLLPQRPGPKKR